jgi:hypothetical protein
MTELQRLQRSLTASYTYGRVTVYATLPQRKSDYLRSRNFQCYPIIIRADMSCDDDSLPVYNLKATYTDRQMYQSYTIENIFTWNVSNYNITVRQMRALLIDMLPLVAALKHYTHFPHFDANKLVNAAAAINACIARHMIATNAAYQVKHNV